MYFAVNEIIELKDKNYLVSKVALIDSDAYYEVKEIDKQTNDLLEEELIIKAINEEGTLFIEEVVDEDLLTSIKEGLK